MKGMLGLFVKRSSIPCVAKDIISSKDYSGHSTPPRSIPITMDLSWNFRMGKQNKLNLNFSVVFIASRRPVGTVRNSFRSPTLWLGKSIAWIFTLLPLCPGNYLL